MLECALPHWDKLLTLSLQNRSSYVIRAKELVCIRMLKGTGHLPHLYLQFVLRPNSNSTAEASSSLVTNNFLFFIICLMSLLLLLCDCDTLHSFCGDDRFYRKVDVVCCGSVCRIQHALPEHFPIGAVKAGTQSIFIILSPQSYYLVVRFIAFQFGPISWNEVRYNMVRVGYCWFASGLICVTYVYGKSLCVLLPSTAFHNLAKPSPGYRCLNKQEQ